MAEGSQLNKLCQLLSYSDNCFVGQLGLPRAVEERRQNGAITRYGNNTLRRDLIAGKEKQTHVMIEVLILAREKAVV